MARRDVADFIIENSIVVELKSKRILGKDDYYQAKRYLSALKLELGLLVNFKPRYVTIKRVLLPIG